MLEHLTLGRKKEALAGVPLVGIGDKCWPRLFIGFADELGAQWAAIVYATLCAIPVPAFLILTVKNVLETPFFCRPMAPCVALFDDL